MNKDKRNNIQLLGTLNNADESGIIANANQVYDANEDKSTQDVSKEHKERIETLETKESSMQTTLENISKTGEASAASNVTYNHSDSKLDATNVQQAIDEVRKKSNYNDGNNVIDFNTIHLITNNPEFICVAVDADNRILYGIKTDGQSYFGVGCPQQVKDYIDEQINKILGTNDITTTIDSLKEIEAFLKDFTNSDTLKALLDTKANKTDVDNTIANVNADIADKYKKSNPNDSEGNIVDTNTIVSIEDNPEYIKALTDSVGKLIEAIGLDGVRKFFAGINIQGVGQYVTDNPEYIVAWLDSQDRIIFAIENDGNPYFGYGVPKQINEFVEQKIAELSLDEYEDIVAFLNGLEEGDKTLQDLLNEKVDKVEGKSLIDEEYASTKSTIDNPEFLDVTTDSEDKVLEGIQKDGTKVIGGSINVGGNARILGNMEVSGVSYKVIESPEYLAAWVDAEDKVIFGLKAGGKTYVGDADFLDDVESIKAFLANFNNKNIDWDALLSITTAENPEFIEAKTDSEGKLLAGRTTDGAAFEKVGFSTPKVSIGGHTIKSIEDPEGRSEIKLDNDNKIINYRKDDGTLVEPTGIETPKLYTDSFKLPEDTKEEVEEIAEEVSDKSSVKIKKYNLPKFGSVNIVNETFYLTADDRYSDLDGVYLIRDYEDTNENAMNHITLDYFYIKSTLTNNGDGTYSKNANSVKLNFYPAGKVAKVSDKFYVLASLGEGGTVLPTSIEVTQLTDIPHINAWPVNKKDEHYCTVTVDFGHYLTGTFKMGVKFQGSSTLNFRKKNFRFTFYKSSAKPYYPYDDDKFGKKEKVKIGEFVRLSGFNLKANWADSTRVKEALMYRLLEAVWDIPGSVDSYPWAKEHTAYTGATGIIKCFPIECNVAGEFYGYDFFGLKKDGKNYLLDKDEDGMFECGTRGNVADLTNWTNARPIDWEDELNDEEDWVIEKQTQSNFDALTEFFAFINSRLYKAEDESTYLVSQVTQVGSKFYVTSTLTPGEGSVTATRTEDPAYIGSDNNLYILSELTDISGTLYVTSTLVDGQPTADSVTAVLSSGDHNIYLGSDGERYLSTDLVTINGVKYVPSKIVWDTTNATEVELIPFDKEHMPDRMSIEHWLKYIVCMQVFLMRDNTCRNMVLYTGSDKKKYYPFFYDLDLSWNFSSSNYNLDIMVPRDGEHEDWGSYAGDMSLWENFKNEWWDEIINCYHVLRSKVLNIPYMQKVLEDITESVPDEVLAKESNRWGVTLWPFSGWIDNMELRLKWLDEEYYK